MRNLVRLSALWLGLLVCGQLFAQGGNGSISGTVTDPSGAVVPNTAVTAKNVATGVVSHATANNGGVYNFPTLQPGPYQITGEATGFQKAVYNDVQLSIESQLTINFQLQVQSSTEAIEVNAQAESVATEASATVGGVISNQRVNELPLPDHSVLGFSTRPQG